MKKQLSEEERRQKKLEYQRNWQREYRKNNREKHNATARKSYNKCKENFTEEYIEERTRKQKIWQDQNHDKVLGYNRKHHAKHREKRNAYNKEYDRTHKEERLARQKKWVDNNRELTRVLRQEYVDKNPELVKKQKKESRLRHIDKNKEKDRIHYINNREHILKQEKDARETKFGKLDHCIFCGYDDERALECHHLIPKLQGGEETKSNIITICSNCHRKIHHPDSDHIGTCKRCDTKEAFIETHHIHPKGKGGTNDPANLVEICACCHRIAHDELRQAHSRAKT